MWRQWGGCRQFNQVRKQFKRHGTYRCWCSTVTRVRNLSRCPWIILCPCQQANIFTSAFICIYLLLLCVWMCIQHTYRHQTRNEKKSNRRSHKQKHNTNTNQGCPWNANRLSLSHITSARVRTHTQKILTYTHNLLDQLHPVLAASPAPCQDLLQAGRSLAENPRSPDVTEHNNH